MHVLQKKPDQLTFLILYFVSCFISLIFIHLHGFVAHDEGWILNPAIRLLNGEAIYKDFHFIYTPGTLLFVSLVFSIFGQSVFVARIAAAGIGIVSMALVFFLVRRLTKNIVLSILASGIFLLWGPLHINFLWPAMFAIPALTATCLFLLKGVHEEKTKFFVLSGVTIALAILSKQNFGVSVTLAASIYLLLFPNKKKRFIALFLGLCAGLFPVFLYFVITNTVGAFFKDMYYFMIEKTLFMGLQKTPFIYPAPLSIEILKTGFYLSPFFISLTAIAITLRTNKRNLIVGLGCLFFYLFGIRPTTDYIHFIPLLSVSGIPLALIITLKKYRYLRYAAISFGIFLLLFGAYDILFRNYYRWDEPLLKHTIFNTNPRIHIWVSRNADTTITELTKIISGHSIPNDYMFVYAYDPLYYFVFNRRNPTRFDFFPPLTRTDEREIIHSLQEKNVPLILTQHPLVEDNGAIPKFIKRNYLIISTKPLYTWEKK